MIILLSIIIAGLLGYFERDGREKIKELYKQINVPKPEIGATPGLYGPQNELNRVNQDGNIGLVSPKTPQQLEWQEQERLREEQLNVRVK